MAIDHHIDNDDKLIVTTCIGTMHEDDLIVALKAYQQNIQNHADYEDYNEVLIFPEKSSVKITAAGLKKIAKIASESDRPHSKRKLSMCVQFKVGYGLAKMYQAYRNLLKSGKKVRVFKAVKPALDWAKKK